MKKKYRFVFQLQEFHDARKTAFMLSGRGIFCKELNPTDGDISYSYRPGDDALMTVIIETKPLLTEYYIWAQWFNLPISVTPFWNETTQEISGTVLKCEKDQCPDASWTDEGMHPKVETQIC